MKDSDYIIIDSPELKTLFAPKQATDEFENTAKEWKQVFEATATSMFDLGDITYRRLRSRAWLATKGKTYPWDDTPLWLLHNDGSRRWVERWRIAMQENFTNWQPAPSAPEPPTNPDEAYRHTVLCKHLVQDANSNAVSFNEGWQAALEYERSKPK